MILTNQIFVVQMNIVSIECLNTNVIHMFVLLVRNDKIAWSDPLSSRRNFFFYFRWQMQKSGMFESCLIAIGSDVFLSNSQIFSVSKSVSWLIDSMHHADDSLVGNYPAQQAFWTAGRGWGLRALVSIKEVIHWPFCWSVNQDILGRIRQWIRWGINHLRRDRTTR